MGGMVPCARSQVSGTVRGRGGPRARHRTHSKLEGDAAEAPFLAWRHLILRQIPIKSAPQAYRFTSIVAMKTCSCYLKAAGFCIVFCMTPVSGTNTIWSVAQTVSAAQF